MGSTRSWVADDHDVRSHRLDVLGGVDERFALRQAGNRRREVLNICGESFGRDAEACSSSGGILKEEIENDTSLECRHLLAIASRNLGERFGGIQNMDNLATGERFKI